MPEGLGDGGYLWVDVNNNLLDRREILLLFRPQGLGYFLLHYPRLTSLRRLRQAVGCILTPLRGWCALNSAKVLLGIFPQSDG